MATVSETIPPALQPDVAAALEWFNRDQATPFEVTGILDPEAALASDAPRELKLVLCGGDRCEQRSFRVAQSDSGREVAFLEDDPTAFAQKKDGPTPQQRIRTAFVRLGIFAARWVAAFATLPTLPVVAVLAGWVAWIVPKIRWVNREFQDVGAG